MPERYYNTLGLNTYVNPVVNDGALIHCVNMVSFPYGAKTKRTGYSAFLGTPDSSEIQSLFSYYKNDDATFYLYRKSGSIVYYSAQGTGAWTTAGNGTVSSSAYMGHAVQDASMIVGDGVGSTRHTSSGTNFQDTTLAPISNSFEIYQGRAYAAGTASTLFYSTSNNITDWATSGTSDSSSFTVPGGGKLGRIFKTGDRIIAPKTTGQMYKWDGLNLVDMTTEYGPSSPNCISSAEDYNFFINQYGMYGFAGAKPQLLSNAIQRQFYNTAGSAIAGSVFSTAQGVCHIYDYLVSVGTVTDDFTQRTMNNCIIKYDFQKNEFLNFDMYNKPTSWLSYKDTNGNKQLIFGGASGQVYKFDTSTTDNGNPIYADMVLVFNYKTPEYEKKWNWFRATFNPGCEARVQVAMANTYTYQTLKWVELGQVIDGTVEYRFPPGSRSILLFVRIYDGGKNSRFTYYGCSIDAQPIIHT